MAEGTVAEVAQLYLGNILYAMELAAIALSDQGKTEDAAYYRAIGRALAEAHGRDKVAHESAPRRPSGDGEVPTR